MQAVPFVILCSCSRAKEPHELGRQITEVRFAIEKKSIKDGTQESCARADPIDQSNELKIAMAFEIIPHILHLSNPP